MIYYVCQTPHAVNYRTGGHPEHTVITHHKVTARVCLQPQNKKQHDLSSGIMGSAW